MTPVLTMSHLSSNEGPCMEYFILRVAVPTPQIMGGRPATGLRTGYPETPLRITSRRPIGRNSSKI